MQSILCCYYVVILDASCSSKLKKKAKKNKKKRKRILAPTWQYTNREDGYETMPIHIFITQSIERKQNKSMC